MRENISPISTMFSTQSERICTIWTTLKLSSANAFNLDKAEILSSGKRLMTVYNATLREAQPIV